MADEQPTDVVGPAQTAIQAWEMSPEGGQPDVAAAFRAVGDHLTVVETIYCTHHGKNPTDVTSRFFVPLTTDNQPYERELKATEEWVPLADKYCWLDATSMISVQNDEGRFPVANPTPEEIEESKLKILELSFDPDRPWHWPIAPGQSIRGCPSDLKALWIRSRHGVTRFTVTIFPS